MASRRSPSLLAAVLAMLAALLVLGAAGGWLLATESGARWLLEGANLQGVRGSLLGPLRAERLRLDTAGATVELHALQLAWSPARLLHGEVHIERLRVGRLVYAAKLDRPDQPARLPASLALPLPLRVDALELEAGELRWGPLSVLRLGGATLAARFDGNAWTLDLRRLTASGSRAGARLAAQMNGQGRIAALPPFALQAQLRSGAQAGMADAALDGQGTVEVDGTLARMDARLAVRVGESTLAGTARIEPFGERVLGEADLALRALDLSALASAWPHTLIDARLQQQRETGTLQATLENRAAATWDRQGLPLRTARLALLRNGDIDGPHVELGTAREAGGSLSGKGRLAGAQASMAVDVVALDLRALHASLPRTRLQGPVRLHKTAEARLDADLRDLLGGTQFTAALMLADERLALEHLRLQRGEAYATASGSLDLAGDKGFAASGEVHRLRLQDLFRGSRLPEVEANGDFTLAGQRAPQLQAALDFRIRDSHIDSLPLAGAGEVRLDAQGLLVKQLTLAAGENRLDAEGKLDERDGQLRFALRAPQLARLGSGYGGSLLVEGDARGSLQTPQLRLQWQAERLQSPRLRLARAKGEATLQFDRRLPAWLAGGSANAELANLSTTQMQLGEARATLRFGAAADAPLHIELLLQRLVTPRLRLAQLSMDADGTSARHALSLQAHEEAIGQRWRVAAEGSREATRWRATLTRLDGEGPLPLRLAAPARLDLGMDQQSLQDLVLQAGTAELRVESLIRDAGGWRSRGSLRELELATLLRFGAAEGTAPPLSTDLRLAGGWDLRFDGLRYAGNAGLRRTSGDVTMHGGANVALGLQTLEAALLASTDGLSLRAEASGSRLGALVLDAQLAGVEQGLQTARLGGAASFNLPSLDWLGPLVSPGTLTEGQLEGRVRLGGSPTEPRFEGALEGRRLRMLAGEAGVDLRNGSLAASFRDNGMQVERLHFEHDGGTLDADGTLAWANGRPDVALAARATRYPLLNRSDRRLRLSGEARLDWRTERPLVAGRLVADSAFIDIGREDTPALSDDVVIAGARPRGGAPLTAAVDLQLDLGDQTRVRGRGLDARLSGQLRLGGESGGAWRAQGNVTVVEGSYSAYGRKLAIEKGVLRFNGPLANPALDITAMRRDQEVEAGVAVRGTVSAPRVTLVSEPVVPDAEKLSWLVLGHGLDSTTGGDISALQSAAGALLSQSAAAGIQMQIATAFGLDEFRIASSGQDNLQQRIVTLGKRLSSRLYISFQQALQATGSVLLLRYTLSPRLTVEAEAGTRSAISLLYNVSFD